MDTTTIATPVASSCEAARIAGLTFRQLDYYVRTGIVDADPPAPGHGHARSWTRRQVYCATLVGRLRSLGVETDVCRDAARAFGESLDRAGVDRDAALILTARPGRWRARIVHIADAAFAAMGLSQHHTVVVPLTHVIDDVDVALAAAVTDDDDEPVLALA